MFKDTNPKECDYEKSEWSNMSLMVIFFLFIFIFIISFLLFLQIRKNLRLQRTVDSIYRKNQESGKSEKIFAVQHRVTSDTLVQD